MLKNFANDSIIIDYGRYPLSKDGEKYIGDIRQFVQRWIDGEPNEGVELKFNDESRSASAISIFGSSHPNSSLRPRLTISYTKK